MLRLRIWRWIWTRAINNGWPLPVIEAVERRFLDAGMREALRRRPMSRSEVEAQRRSWAYGQVAMHDPSVTREIVDAVADTIPAPWSCIAGDLADHDAGIIDEHDLARDLHDAEEWRQRGGAARKGWVV